VPKWTWSLFALHPSISCLNYKKTQVSFWD
jgi:hypothetical protein